MYVSDREIFLTPTEYDILRLLAQNLGKVITHHQLLLEVWGYTSEENIHLLRVNISNLRLKATDFLANLLELRFELSEMAGRPLVVWQNIPE